MATQNQQRWGGSLFQSPNGEEERWIDRGEAGVLGRQGAYSETQLSEGGGRGPLEAWQCVVAVRGSHTKSEISFDTLRLVSADTRTLSKSNISTAFSFRIECLLPLSF